MKIFKLIFKNLLRHKLRSLLTVTGIGVAVMAFVLLRTVLSAWDIALEQASPNRLITRHAVSFIFPMPLSYKEKIAAIPGVTGITYMNWFQGIYIEEKNFFPRIAVEVETLFDIYSEFIVPPDQLATFKKERNSCVVGRKTAEKFKFKIGDIIQVRGDIFPGDYQFVIRGIYKGRDRVTDETQMMFHWNYLNERMLQEMPIRAGQVGWYAIRIANPADAARISMAVDELFKNSPAETKTETEKAFTQGFISMSSAIITAMEFISYIIIGVILLVLANTMVMTARERIREYAVLKTLGFSALHIVGLIAGESLTISVMGGIVGLLLASPVVSGVSLELSNYFPIFEIQTSTLITAGMFALFLGITASLFPIYRALNTKIVDGLRQVG